MPEHPAARKGDPHTCPKEDKEVIKGSCWGQSTKVTKHDRGPIMEGSPNVNVNGRPAARCTDKASCTPVGASPMIVTGLKMVRINGHYAAAKGSRVVHKGTVTDGSKNVNYGGTIEGVKLGDAEDATRACQEAAKGRNTKDYEDNPKSQEQQSKKMNCGPEAVRQMCLEECNRNPSNDNIACAARLYTEDSWYRRYLEDKQIKEMNAEYQKENAADVEQEQKQLTDDMNGADEVEEEVEYATSSKWESCDQPVKPEPGKRYRITKGGETKEVTYPHPHSPKAVTDKNFKGYAKRGELGSSNEQRAYMLRAWCGFSEVNEGENSEDGIAGDLTPDHQVNAVVDISKLPGHSGSKSPPKPIKKREKFQPHVVQVTEMKYTDDGELDYVIVNDTSYGGRCRRPLTGKEFNHALIPGRKTDVATRPKKP